jgi:hypothetical protein
MLTQTFQQIAPQTRPASGFRINSNVVIILTGLMAARLVSAAADVATGHPVFSLGPVEMLLLAQALMALSGGMPHPSLLRTMTVAEFAYTWLYNSANIIFQNLEKRYHPPAVDKPAPTE